MIDGSSANHENNLLIRSIGILQLCSLLKDILVIFSKISNGCMELHNLCGRWKPQNFHKLKQQNDDKKSSRNYIYISD